MKPPKNGGEFWGFNDELDEDDDYSFDEDEENIAGFKPILKVIFTYLIILVIKQMLQYIPNLLTC